MSPSGASMCRRPPAGLGAPCLMLIIVVTSSNTNSSSNTNNSSNSINTNNSSNTNTSSNSSNSNTNNSSNRRAMSGPNYQFLALQVASI